MVYKYSYSIFNLWLWLLQCTCLWCGRQKTGTDDEKSGSGSVKKNRLDRIRIRNTDKQRYSRREQGPRRIERNTNWMYSIIGREPQNWSTGLTLVPSVFNRKNLYFVYAINDLTCVPEHVWLTPKLLFPKQLTRKLGNYKFIGSL
jgi:hypothetical protein